MHTHVRPYIHPYGYCAQRCQVCTKLAAICFKCPLVTLWGCFAQSVPKHEPDVWYDMQWRTVVLVCLRESVPGPSRLMGTPPPPGCTCRMQMSGKQNSPPEK